MRFAVVPMRRRGRPVDRHELANRIPVVGDLRVEEVRDDALGRYVRTARVVDPIRPIDPDLLPALRDPVLIAMRSAISDAFPRSPYASGCVEGSSWRL